MSIKLLLAGAAWASVFVVAPAYAEDLVFTLNNQSSGAVNELYVGPPAAYAEDLTFMLDNKSSGAISEFYASTTDTNDWEEDILGADTLAAGGFARITIADGKTICTYDLKIIWESGEETEERNIDLCATGSYTVTD
jgi:hypothetical protein